MAAKIRQGFIDYSGENSSTQFYVLEAAGDDYTSAIADAGTVAGGIAVVTLCNLTSRTLSKLIDSDVPVIPASTFAQREFALLVQYVDVVTGQFGSMEIPGPDLALLGQANTDEVDIVSNITAAAFLAILEANLVSRADNAIEVTGMRIIGRAS